MSARRPRPVAVSLPRLAPVGRTSPSGNFTAAWPGDTFESITVGWCYNLDRTFDGMLPKDMGDYAYRYFVECFAERFEDAIDGTVRPLDAIAPPPEVLAAIRAAWTQARADMMTWDAPVSRWSGPAARAVSA
jgi:hypothetical protein